MPRQPDAGAADLARLVDAGGDQHRVVPRAQFGEADSRRPTSQFELEPDAGLLAAASQRRSTTSFSSLKFGMP